VTYAFFFRKYKEVLGIKKLMDKKKSINNIELRRDLMDLFWQIGLCQT